jgi:hypothetical protein
VRQSIQATRKPSSAITRVRVTTPHRKAPYGLGAPRNSDRAQEGDLRSANGEIVHQRLVEISVKGELDASSIEELDDVDAIADRGVTRLRAAIRDDSALYGLLERLQAHGLEVLAVLPYAELPPAPANDRSP